MPPRFDPTRRVEHRGPHPIFSKDERDTSSKTTERAEGVVKAESRPSYDYKSSVDKRHY